MYCPIIQDDCKKDCCFYDQLGCICYIKRAAYDIPKQLEEIEKQLRKISKEARRL